MHEQCEKKNDRQRNSDQPKKYTSSETHVSLLLMKRRRLSMERLRLDQGKVPIRELKKSLFKSAFRMTLRPLFHIVILMTLVRARLAARIRRRMTHLSTSAVIGHRFTWTESGGPAVVEPAAKGLPHV
jgi:hypothetical protein